MVQTDRGDVEIFETPADLAAGLAQLIADCASFAITERGAFYIALAGGTTPRAAYTLLGEEPMSTEINWDDTFIFFSDERCVPPGDPQSNYKMAEETLLEHIKIPPHNVHRMRGEDDPAKAAAAYDKILQQDLGENPRFDLILLGMGPEGHTASLFPGSLPADDGKTLVAAPYIPKLKSHRITFTPRLVNNARRVAIATEGAGKAPMLAAVMNGPLRPDLYPVQLVAPTDGELKWMVDRLAASELNT
ncbi:MAG: 6-phosphogluconolactonase [Candidatus Eremiobacteraeota bacterium]|nr:6-phosphogluconolactonase [Candidatus Eremiobacteraeota bacterium]